MKRAGTLKRGLAAAALLLAAALLPAAGCKNAGKLFEPKEKPKVVKAKPWPRRTFVAFYKQDPGTGAFQIWRMNPDGTDAAQIAELNNPKGYGLADLGPTVSIMAYDTQNLRLFYTYEKKLFRYDTQMKSNELVAEMISLPNRGIDWMWFSKDHTKILAHCAGSPSPAMYKNQEYVQVDLKTGAQRKVSPEDPAWDNYTFFNDITFFIIDAKTQDTTYPAPAGGAYFAFEQGAGKGGWPMLVIAGADGTRRAVTDGTQRVLAARWTPSGRALAFITGESCDTVCRGRIFAADPATGPARAASQSMFRFDALLNMRDKDDAMVYGETAGGVMRVDFKGEPQSLAADGAAPFLFEMP